MATVTLTATDLEGLRTKQDVPVTVEPGADPDRFDIAVVALHPHQVVHYNEIRRAAAHMETVVVGDIPDEDYSRGAVADPLSSWPEVFMGILDDVRVLVHVGRLAHSGGGRTWRDASDMPLVGNININVLEDDADRLFTTGLHELGHVLGIGHGPLWSTWLRDYDWENPKHTHLPGPLAIEAFDAAGGSAYAGAKVPVDNYRHTPAAHWRRSVMSRELMGPCGGVLSAVTIQALADMGYVVDVGRAEPFEITLSAPVASADAAAGYGLVHSFACAGAAITVLVTSS